MRKLEAEIAEREADRKKADEAEKARKAARLEQLLDQLEGYNRKCCLGKMCGKKPGQESADDRMILAEHELEQKAAAKAAKKLGKTLW